MLKNRLHGGDFLFIHILIPSFSCNFESHLNFCDEKIYFVSYDSVVVPDIVQ